MLFSASTLAIATNGTWQTVLGPSCDVWDVAFVDANNGWATGEIVVLVPRVSDTVEPFQSSILAAWQRRSQVLDEVLPLLYLEGLSPRDFRRALRLSLCLRSFVPEAGFSNARSC